MKTTIILIAVATSLACSSAHAQQPRESAMDWFHRMDRNKDRKLSKQEVPSPRFKEFDANGDGFVTEEEFKAHIDLAASGQGSKRRSPGSAGISDELLKALTYHKESPGPVPLSDSKAFTDLQFTRDWIPGTKDRNGRLMTGTECNYIVAHGGRLYAAVSMWNHDPAAPNPGASVLVRPSASAPWEVDTYFPPPSLRVAVLASLTLTNDGQGKPLAKPLSLLVAGGSLFESPNETAVFVRDDATGKWIKSLLAGRGARDRGEVRLLMVHRDQVTGVDRVIVAVTNGNVYSGAFEAAAPGKIRWNPEAELSGRLGRIMSCGEANGQAYLAVDITPEAPKNGGLFRRVDSAKPSWEWIGEWGHRVQHRGVAWVRGLTAIPDPEHSGKELLLCSREVDGLIETINPQQGHEPRVEFDLRKHFGGLVGAQEGQRLTTLFAYNEMTPAVHPDTGERVLLIAGGIMPGLQGDDARAKSAWYLVRHSDGRYGTGQVFDPAITPQAVGGRRSARTVCVSPFSEDKGRVLYFGGFDAAQGPHRDTAWIYKGTLSAERETRP
jgi:hypothetical protein